MCAGLYCYYHGAYCQFCEFYNEYAQLGNKAKGWGQYRAKPQGGSPEGTTEYDRLTSEQKGKWNGASHRPSLAPRLALVSPWLGGHLSPRAAALTFRCRAVRALLELGGRVLLALPAARLRAARGRRLLAQGGGGGQHAVHRQGVCGGSPAG